MLRRPSVVVAAACLAVLAVPAAASAGTAPSGTSGTRAAGPIVEVGPDQYFAGLVNGQTDQASIQVGCFGPIYPGETGHPLSGQTVGIRLLSSGSTGSGSRDVGYTGSASSIAVTLTAGTSTEHVTVFDAYGNVPLSTKLTVPCSGSGSLRFDPTPASTASSTAVVDVTFVSQP